VRLSQAEIEALVGLHTARIAEAVPEGRTSVSGSTLLGRYGGHDVDLVVLVPHVGGAAERLRRTYPPSTKTTGETTGLLSDLKGRLR
jgi:hypothetical protein